MACKKSFAELFAELFGGPEQSGEVYRGAFEREDVVTAEILRDDIQLIAEKMENIADVARGFPVAVHMVEVPESIVRQATMTPKEKKQYDAWKEGRMVLPPFNWSYNKAEIPTNKDTLKLYLKRAAALDAMYEHKGATVGNVAWYMTNWEFAMPLMSAIVRVENAWRHQTGGRSKPNGLEMVQLQAVNQINAIAASKVRKIQWELNAITAVIKNFRNTELVRGQAPKRHIDGDWEERDMVSERHTRHGKRSILYQIDCTKQTIGTEEMIGDRNEHISMLADKQRVTAVPERERKRRFSELEIGEDRNTR